ncbi:unnamed protein product [marine sediment metagenome]|uniref:Uncharacterized protein n=1 Tax=marine sediment metagenome TaxID=412755 RepID=X1HRU1_9ZZZZ
MNSTLSQLRSFVETEISKVNETFGWVQEFRDTITEFFADPLQWFYDRLEEIFERYW